MRNSFIKTGFVMQVLLVLIIFIIQINPSNSQSWQWAASMGGNGSTPNSTPDEKVNDMEVDTFGNIYTCGNLRSNATFNGLPVTTYSNVGYTGFLAKYDCNGIPIWIKTYGGAAYNTATSLELDDDGYIYLTGQLNGSVLPGEQLHFIDTILSGNYSDFFLSKLDTSGNLIWLSNAGGNNNQLSSIPIGMAIDPLGRINIIVKAPSSAGGELFPGFPVVRAIYITRFDTSGVVDKVNMFATTIESLGFNLHLKYDQSGDLYMATYIAIDTVEIANQLIIKNYQNSGIGELIFMKIDSLENTSWFIQMGDTNYFAYGYGVEVDAANDVYLSGTVINGYNLQGHVFNVPGPVNQTVYPFVAKFTPQGNLIWASSPQYIQYNTHPYGGLTLMPNGNLAFSGNFPGTAQFGSTSLTSVNQRDVFLAEVSSTGTMLSATTFSSTGTDIKPVVTLADAFNNVYIAGSFDATITINGTTHTNQGGNSNGFIAKYGYQCTTGLEEDTQSTLAELKLYPNPANNFINFRLYGMSGNISLSIFDITGREVLTVSQVNYQQEELKIPVSQLKSGVYLLRVQDKNGVKFGKFIKE